MEPKKFLLISPEFINRLKDTRDESMKEKSKKVLYERIPASKKWLKFRKFFDQYLSYLDKNKEAIKLPIHDSIQKFAYAVPQVKPKPVPQAKPKSPTRKKLVRNTTAPQLKTTQSVTETTAPQSIADPDVSTIRQASSTHDDRLNRLRPQDVIKQTDWLNYPPTK